MNLERNAGLRREVGLFGAMMMGMGSIVGTGVFVSIGIAAEVAGPSVILAIFLASLVAICNGLSSAQLAANHPVSGGTYEYGYRWLSPSLGFAAGWLFLLAKSASAATAALGFSGYLLHAIGWTHDTWLVPMSLAALAALTMVVLRGIKVSSTTNMIVVIATLLALTFFVITGLPTALANAENNLTPFFAGTAQGPVGILQATALMFVAFTGYGRIATLGEEVKDPERTIPRAVAATLMASMVLYVSVAVVAVGSVGAYGYGATTRQQVAPLEVIAAEFGVPHAGLIMAAGAVTAMLGVLLNLLLGLSRVLLAMGRRSDMPGAVAMVNVRTGVPTIATLAVAAAIGGLVLLGDVRSTWSFSAFTVLIYYALTNLCAMRLRPDERLFPVWPAYIGLVSCLFLAFWVDWQVWLVGLALIFLGTIWQRIAVAIRRT